MDEQGGQTRNTAFRSGDMQQYGATRANLKKGLSDAKVAYRQKIEVLFSSSNLCQAWQGIRHIISSFTDGSALEAEHLNLYFARFKVEGTTTISQSLVLQPADVIRILRRINIRKAGRILRDCAAELGEVFTNIFNLSLSQFSVPT